MVENKRFELCVDSNNQKSIGDNEKEDGEPLLCLNRFGEICGIDEVCDLLNEQEELIKRLKEELFEARKDYIVDTADISDKPYLDEMIEEERKEIYGDVE